MAFEVTRATLKGWVVKTAPKTSDGVYLEMYLENKHAKRCTPWGLLLAGWKCIRCKCLRRRNKVTEQEAKRRTNVLSEHTEVVWHKYNANNILVPLFTCSGRGWRMKRGKPTILVCDLMRHSTKAGPSEKLLSLKGEFLPGTSHKVTLLPVRPAEEAYKEGPAIILDIRHATLQQFTLERARPIEQLQIIESIRAMHLAQNRHFFGSGLGNLGRRTVGRHSWLADAVGAKITAVGTGRDKSGYKAAGTQDMESVPTSGPQSTLPSAPSRMLSRGESWAGAGFAQMASVPSIRQSQSVTTAESGDSSRNGQRGRAGTAWLLWRSSDELNHSLQGGGGSRSPLSPFERHTTSTFGSVSLEQGLLSHEQSFREDASRDGSPLGVSKHKSQTALFGATSTYSHWLPHVEEWRKIWPSNWPAQGDDLGGKHEVAPLMESQFRKDCIIFFNTLFPRWRAGKFAELRLNALNPTSKLAFKMAPALPIESTPILRRSDTQGLANATKQILLRPFGVWSETTAGKPSATFAVADNTPTEPLSTRRIQIPETWGARAPADTEEGEESRERRHSGGGSRISFHSDATMEVALPTENSGYLQSPRPANGLSIGLADPVASATSSAVRGSASVSEASQNSAPATTAVASSSRAAGEVVTFQSHTQTNVYTESSENLANSQTFTVQSNSEQLDHASHNPDPTSSNGPQDTAMRLLRTLTNTNGFRFYDDYSPRILFLKRLFICFATCGVYYSEEGEALQASVRRLWPYPIASLLGHGSRILIRLEDVDASEFLNFLLSGNPYTVNWSSTGVPAPLMKRTAATHAVGLEDSGDLIEKKLKVTSMQDNLENLADGRKGKHLGLNLPIGGAGNPSPMGRDYWVSFSGRVVSTRVKDDQSVLASLMTKIRRNSTVTARTGGESSTNKVKHPSNNTNNNNAGGDHTPKDADDLETGSFQGSQKSNKSTPSKTSRTSRKSNVSKVSRRTRQSMGSFVSGVTARRHSVGSKLSDDRAGRRGSAGSAVPTDKSWRYVPSVQGGHLYIRMDDFGPRVYNGGKQEEFMNARGPLRQGNVMRRLVGKQHKPASLHRLALACLDRGTQDTMAGSLSFPLSVQSAFGPSHHAHTVGTEQDDPMQFDQQQLHHTKRMEEDSVVLDALGRTLRLLRVRSMPARLHGAVAQPSPDDVRWVRQMLVHPSSKVLQPHPPTPDALRALLCQYVPATVQLLGKHGASTIEDLQDELTTGKCALMKKGRGLQRFVESVVLQLKWKDYLLTAMPETSAWTTAGEEQENLHSDDRTRYKVLEPQSANSSALSGGYRLPCTRVSSDEPWEKAMKRFMRHELTVHEDSFMKCLRPWEGRHGCYSVLEDTASTTSYPGLKTCYRTHILQWEIKEGSRAYFDNRGLGHGDPDLNIMETAGPGGTVLPFHFMTVKDASPCCKAIFWRWTPINQVHQTYHWLFTQHVQPERLPIATDAQVWAFRAAQQEGIVGAPPLGAPPSEAALVMLLERCGYEAPMMDPDEYFNNDGLAPTTALFNDISSQICHLLLKEKTLLHVTEVLVLRLRLRGKVLVKIPPPPDQDNFSTLMGTKLTGETARESIERLLKEDLGIIAYTMKSSLDTATVIVCEEYGEELVPGLMSLRRMHMATVEVKDIMQRRRSHHSLASLMDSTASAVDPDADDAMPLRRLCMENMKKGKWKKSSSMENLDDAKSPEFMWLTKEEWEETQSELEEGWWRQAEIRSKEKRRVSSVLLGLEGSEPHANSPFNIKHDASGASKEISALGNRKWRAFRLNDAMQIPNDHGGMRLEVSRRMFEEFIEVCEKLNLVDPFDDLRLNTEQGLPRNVLEHRYFEEELFKQILGGSVQEARRAIDWACRYRDRFKTVERAYAAVNSPQRR